MLDNEDANWRSTTVMILDNGEYYIRFDNFLHFYYLYSPVPHQQGNSTTVWAPKPAHHVLWALQVSLL